MTFEEALVIVESSLEHKRLNKMQEAIFRQSWEGQSYQEIACNCGYDLGYVKDTGCKLWKLLSEAFGEKVTKNNFQLVLKQRWVSLCVGELQLLPEKVAPNSTTAKHYQEWGDAIDVSSFFGRTAELAKLEQYIVKERCRLVVVLGMGGIGKTAMAVSLANKFKHEFEYLIWRSLRNAPPLLDLLAELLQFLSQQQETDLPAALDSRVSRLLKYLRAHRCLLLLDNAESVLLAGVRTGSYREGYEGYGQLLRCVAETCHQSTLVLTSREKPIGLAAKEGETLPVRSLQLTGLPTEEGRKIFQARGSFQGSEDDWKVLIEYYAGNPLALKMVAPAIRDFFDSNISKFSEILKQGNLVFDDVNNLLRGQLDRLSVLEKELMYWLAVNQKPVSFLELQAAFVPKKASLSELLESLNSLQQRSLIEKKLDGFMQQPMVIEYISEKLIKVKNSVSSSRDETIKLWSRTKASAETVSGG